MDNKCKHCGSVPISTRLFDLVRYCRGQLHEDGLITELEYAWLTADADLAKGAGSPSPRRLEEYDELRTELTLTTANLTLAEKRNRSLNHQLDQALQQIAILRDEVEFLNGKP